MDKWKNIMNKDLIEVGCEGGRMIELAQDKASGMYR
jgi:hypothetical protein